MASNNGKSVLAFAAEARTARLSLFDRAIADEEVDSAPAWRLPWFAGGRWGRLLCVAYPLLLLTPLFIFAAASPPSHDTLVANVAVHCAVVAFTILAMQFVLTARVRWMEAPFGLDVILRFHKGMALVSVCFLCAHPLLLASVEGWGLLTRWSAGWPIWAGRIALVLLLAQAAIAAGRRIRQLRYEIWLLVHNVAAFVLLGLAFIHSMAVGDDFVSAGPRIVCTSLLLIAWSAWFYRRVARPHVLACKPYKVVAVRQETASVWTLILELPFGNCLHFVPGQFVFLRPLTGLVPAEEHPFSISSSPSRDGRISLTIKESGDFTSAISKLSPGDLVTLHGPFGRFSNIFHPESDDLVFVAAGVGITPIMSMLRHMHSHGDARRVTLIYANRDAASIVFRQEIAAIESSRVPLLRVVHIVSHAMDDWRLYPGRLDMALVYAICRDLTDKAFFICCPPRMTASLIGGLRRAGVNPGRIHADHFGF